MDEGLVRNIGVSNFSSRQIQRILQEGRIKPSCCQVRNVSFKDLNTYFKLTLDDEKNQLF